MDKPTAVPLPPSSAEDRHVFQVCWRAYRDFEEDTSRKGGLRIHNGMVERPAEDFCADFVSIVRRARMSPAERDTTDRIVFGGCRGAILCGHVWQRAQVQLGKAMRGHIYPPEAYFEQRTPVRHLTLGAAA